MSEPPHGIRIGPTTDGKGRGVFATRPIAEGEVVELAPVVVIAPSTSRYVSRTVLNDYVFGWGDDAIAVVLGYGSLYNHSWEPNLRYRTLLDDDLVEFTAVRDIAAGEELMTNYASASPARAAFLQHLH